MADKRLPLIELDPDQSGVPDGYTRYILRAWGNIYHATLDGISIDEYGEPVLEIAGPEPGVVVEDGEGYTTDQEPTSPDDVSYVYLTPGGTIDPRVFRLRVPPPPTIIPSRQRLPLDSNALPAPFPGLYEGTDALHSSSSAPPTALYDGSVMLLTKILTENGAPEHQTPSFYLDFIQENGLLPPIGGNARFVDICRKFAVGSQAEKASE